MSSDHPAVDSDPNESTLASPSDPDAENIANPRTMSTFTIDRPQTPGTSRKSDVFPAAEPWVMTTPEVATSVNNLEDDPDIVYEAEDVAPPHPTVDREGPSIRLATGWGLHLTAQTGRRNGDRRWKTTAVPLYCQAVMSPSRQLVHYASFSEALDWANRFQRLQTRLPDGAVIDTPKSPAYIRVVTTDLSHRLSVYQHDRNMNESRRFYFRHSTKPDTLSGQIITEESNSYTSDEIIDAVLDYIRTEFC